MRKDNLSIKETFDLAIQHHQKKDLKVAEKLYQEVLKSNPNHAISHNNLGALYNELGEPQKAKDCYEKAIKIDPNYADAFGNLGNILKELGEPQKAKDCYEKALKFKLTESPEKGLFAYNAMHHRGFFFESGLTQIKKGYKQLPLLTWPFLDFMKTLNLNDTTMHELGSGNSTIWFSNIFSKIKSYETNQKFYESLLPKLKENVTLKLIDLAKLYSCPIEFKTRDWLLIDFSGKRTKFVQKLVGFADDKIPAQIILDNSENYRNGAKLLTDRGYFEISFYGFKSGQSWISCTSLFLLKNKFKLNISPQFFYPKFSYKLQNDWDTNE